MAEEEVTCSCSLAIRDMLACRLCWAVRAMVWFVVRLITGYLPTIPVRLIRVSSISSMALMTREAPW